MQKKRQTLTPGYSRNLSTTFLSNTHNWSTDNCAMADERVSAFSAVKMVTHSPHIHFCEDGGVPPMHLRCHERVQAVQKTSTDSLWHRQQNLSFVFFIFFLLLLVPLSSTGESIGDMLELLTRSSLYNAACIFVVDVWPRQLNLQTQILRSVCCKFCWQLGSRDVK